MKKLCTFFLLCIAAVLPAQVRIPGPGGTPGVAPDKAFITNQILGTPRNDQPGSVGFRVMVGAANLTVTQLGRWIISGNTDTHLVKITADGTNTALASCSVDTSVGTPGTYEYCTLGTPFLMLSGVVYAVLVVETTGSDFWYDNSDTSVSPSADGTVPSGSFNGGGNGGMNMVYVPPNFKYHL